MDHFLIFYFPLLVPRQPPFTSLSPGFSLKLPNSLPHYHTEQLRFAQTHEKGLIKAENGAGTLRTRPLQGCSRAASVDCLLVQSILSPTQGPELLLYTGAAEGMVCAMRESWTWQVQWLTMPAQSWGSKPVLGEPLPPLTLSLIKVPKHQSLGRSHENKAGLIGLSQGISPSNPVSLSAESLDLELCSV